MGIFELRKWQKNDAESIAIVANNSAVAANLRNAFPNPYTLEDAKWYVDNCINNEGIKQITRSIVVGEKAVGSIGIFLKEDVYEKSGELGYWLAEEYWRQGIMSSAVKKICKEAFVQFDVERIFAEPFETNVGSRRVLENAGFTYEGTMRNGVYKNSKLQSYCMYSILKKEID
ncbi:MAG: GNAT family N-acetyltransferase [Firmicutes bacterium HGW-Firmicutes-5]|jgi:ribosomal-protein-alanine N-acetyltransferase|nr:MAG: GNAT family N-acetyltransferase [Firmicutes bacterium HGW-Firmicutes-5]